MQNWNQWQLSAGTVTTPMPQPPVGYATPGADPMAMMQTYMQYYNQPAPSGYTPEQWAAAQQQGWAQWQQWQQQYQQWQAQYGEKYQQTMKQMGLAAQAPGLSSAPASAPAPPLPKDEAKPPLPPSTVSTYQFTSMPPPHQNNLPLFPAKQSASSTTNPPLPPGQPPLPPDASTSDDNSSSGKRPLNAVSECSSAKKMKIEDEELTEAEKTFDAQFKEWEEQFNKWKEQNANHPDKTQYKQYEAKWTTWREKLIERREQMRKKREQQKQAVAKAEVDKKSLPGDEKILNILSNSENQGLINNLLGIGKSLGLTGKQTSNITAPPPPPPLPPATEASSPNTQLIPSPQIPTSAMQTQASEISTSAPWNPQQWPPQPNAGENSAPFSSFQPRISGSSTSLLNAPFTPPNFTQPPPNYSVTPNFSQPPPGFSSSDVRSPHTSIRPPISGNLYGRPLHGSEDGPGQNLKSSTENTRQPGPLNNAVNQSPSFGLNEPNRSTQQGNNFRPDSFAPRNDNYKFNDDRSPRIDQFRRDDRNYPDANSPFNRHKTNFNSESNKFGPAGDRFGQDDYSGPPSDRFGPGSENRFGPGPQDRFGSGNDRFGPGAGDRFGNDRFSSDRFGPGNDRFTPGNDKFGSVNNRPESNNDRFNTNNDRFGGDRFNRSNFDRPDQKDSFNNNSRNFNRNNQFQPPDELAPELKKLMEKRKAARDVFKPSFLDSDRSSNVGSLSESFRKITGDLPFMKNPAESISPKDFGGLRSNNFGPRGSSNFNPQGSGNFRFFGSEFRPQGPDFGPRGGAPPFGPRIPFDTRDVCPPPFRGPIDLDQRIGRNFDSDPINPERGSKFIGTNPRHDWNNSGMTRPLNNVAADRNEESANNPNEHSSTAPSIEIAKSASIEQGSVEEPARDPIPLLEKTPWTGEGQSQAAVQNSTTDQANTAIGPTIGGKTDLHVVKEGPLREDNVDNAPDMHNTGDPTGKNSELPFMGENDPKPEDLNMEPPPELPNLGPIVTDGTDELTDSVETVQEPTEERGLPRAFPPKSEPFGPRSPFDGPSGPRGMQFRPNASPIFAPRGHQEPRFPFGPRGPNAFPLNSSPNLPPFRSQPSNMAQFGPQNSNGPDGQFGPGPGPRGFGPPRLNDIPFDNRGPDNYAGPSDRFSSQKRHNDSFPGHRGPNENVFGPRGPKDMPFGLRGCNDRSFSNEGSKFASPDPWNRNDDQFGNRPPFGRSFEEFRTRASKEDLNSNTPYGGFKPDSVGGNSDRNIDRGGTDMRGDGRTDLRGPMFDNSEKSRLQDMDPGTRLGPNEPPTPLWKQPFSKNNFGDTDQRVNMNPDIPPLPINRSTPLGDKLRSEKDIGDSIESSVGDSNRFGGPNIPSKRPLDNRQSQARCPGQEFCIEKQFNYNHGELPTNKKFVEYVPAKIIDYGHTSRISIQDNLNPVQCFDYGHGNLKPTVPDKETISKKDFRHWEESEQNLRDYTEKMRKYGKFPGGRDCKRSVDYGYRMESERMDDRRYDYERRGKDTYRRKERMEDRYERISERDNDVRYQNDRSNNKDHRPQERSEITHKDTSKENSKEDDRSKGSISWQDSSSKNNIGAKLQDVSVSESKNNVLENPPKTLELAKTPNCTMVDDLLCPPGRQNRPPKIAIILRGPPGSGKSFVAKLIKDKEVAQGGSAPRILSLDDYFLIEKERESKDDNGKKVTIKEMVYEYEEAMEQSYTVSLVKAFKKNITDGFFNFIILDCINEKISDYEDMWSFAKTKGFKVYVCEMEMDLQICLKRNIHNRTEEEINRIIDYFEPTPSYHQKLDVNSMLQEQAIEEVHMEDTQETDEKIPETTNEDSQDSQEDVSESLGVSKWERMEAEDKLDRLDGLAKMKHEGKVQTMKDFLQVPDYYNMEDTSGKKRVRWADLEERKEQEKMRAVGFVVGHTNWDRMMDPTKGGSALTRTKYI